MSPAKRLRLYLPPFTTSKSTSLWGPISPRAAEPKRIIFSGAATFTMRRIISLSFLWSTVFLWPMFCRSPDPILSLPYSLPERLSLATYGDCFPVAYCLTQVASSDHLVGSHQHVGRNRQTDLLRRFQIDDELKLHGLLNG